MVPFNPAVVLSSSQVLTNQPTNQLTNQLTTPPPAELFELDLMYRTPVKPHDLYEMQQHLQQSEMISKPTRLAFTKARKTISTLTTRLAQVEMEKNHLKQALDSINNTYGRKRVPIDPNHRVHELPKIIESINRASLDRVVKMSHEFLNFSENWADEMQGIVHEHLHSI
jgi:hypothetical protein